MVLRARPLSGLCYRRDAMSTLVAGALGGIGAGVGGGLTAGAGRTLHESTRWHANGRLDPLA